jgi:hypothetical protein
LDAHNIIAGFIPFLRNEGHTYFLKMFSTEALQCHASSKWDPINMEVGTAEEAELSQFLAEDDDLNFTDEPTHERPQENSSPKGNNTENFVSIDMPTSTPLLPLQTFPP